MRRLALPAFLIALLHLAWGLHAAPAKRDGNRLTYLDAPADPYYVGRGFAKLTTPQWVGEEGVEAVVILAIDDMRDHRRYEAYLRPILERLKRIDGRAPVSIMTNQIDPATPHLQQWLKEGVSIETHTFDHPCPLLAGGDFAKAKSTYDRCVDRMSEIPNTRPVAFRMPCCDSLNTPSPRFYAEIFNKVTEKGRFLSIDSSVFNITTANDPDLPRGLVLEADGRERFRKYVPFESFVNTIEDYPYPYVIGKLCWEFPCATPSDWQAQHVQKPNNPKTVEDWKALLDVTVIKQGVMNLVFHPHGWIKAEQIVELIDHAEAKHGKKVKFLTFSEALERLEKNMLGGQSLRDEKGEDNGVRVLDVNNDGYMDVITSGREPGTKLTRIWSPADRQWVETPFPATFRLGRFGILKPDGMASIISRNYLEPGGFFNEGVWHFDGRGWVADARMLAGLKQINVAMEWGGMGPGDSGLRLRDLDGDGLCELVDGRRNEGGVFTWEEQAGKWGRLPFRLPDLTGVMSADRDTGLRFVDIDHDGDDDILFSNGEKYSLHLFTSMKEGWSKQVIAGKRGEKPAEQEIPAIVRADGTDNGAWFHSGHLWVQNEDTTKMPNLVDRRAFAALLKDAEPGAKGPRAALESIRVRAGFKVELVAAEPLVMDPVALAFGADGKLWVAEMGDYPRGEDGKGKAAGKVRYLEDADGDGIYDKSTVFLDGLAFPTGVMAWGKGALVVCAPEIFYAEDRDGDGKAEVREVLLSGFTPGNQQHRVNGLYYGLDNWVYGANGDSGGTVTSIKTGKKANIRGRDFRFRPQDGAFEPQTGQTQYGRTTNDWGDHFGCNNPNPMYHFTLADHYLRRNPHVAGARSSVSVLKLDGLARVYPISSAQPRFNDPHTLDHFTSACGVRVYRDDLFGEMFTGNAFVCEPVHNLVSRLIVAPDGSTFTAARAPGEEKAEFLASTDNWFRPVFCAVGPDGALYVADMYRHVIEHPEWIPADWQARLDLRAGHDKGRIYRVAPVGEKLRPIPRLDKLDAAELAAALDSPSGWQRDMAQQLIVERQLNEATPHLKKLMAESTRPQARLHAMCALDGLGALDVDVLKKGLGDGHGGVRRHAVRLCEGMFAGSPQLGEMVAKLAGDDDVQVRIQVAYSLGEWKDERAAEALARIALRDAGDPYLLPAVMSSVTRQTLTPFVRAVTRENGAPPGELIDGLMRMAGAGGDSAAIAALLGGATRAEESGTLARLYDAMSAAGVDLAPLARKDQAVKAAAEQARKVLDGARAVAADGNAPIERRRAAVRLLNRDAERAEEDTTALAALLSPRADVSLHIEAVTALGRRPHPRTPELLLNGWRTYGPEVRGKVIDMLAARSEWVAPLLDAVEQGQLSPRDFDASRRRRLAQHPSPQVRARVAKLLTDSVSPDRQKVVESFREALSLSGDVARGKEVFVKACANCHRMGDVGRAVGPDVAGLGDKSPQSLLAAILDPNRAVEAKYTDYLVETKSGQSVNGVITAETGNSVTIQPAGAEPMTVLRTDIRSMRGTGVSLMPEGLESGYAPQDMADLIAFLRGAPAAAAQRKTFEGNVPRVVRPGEQGILRLLPSAAEIYGSTVVLEKRHGNLGYWSSEDDRAAWRLEGVKPGRYAVWIDYACADDSAGNTFILEADGQVLMTGTVEGTGDWDTYRKASVGAVTLNGGEQRITFRSAGKIDKALIDLRGVELVPPNRL